MFHIPSVHPGPLIVKPGFVWDFFTWVSCPPNQKEVSDQMPGLLIFARILIWFLLVLQERKEDTFSGGFMALNFGAQGPFYNYVYIPWPKLAVVTWFTIALWCTIGRCQFGSKKRQGHCDSIWWYHKVFKRTGHDGNGNWLAYFLPAFSNKFYSNWLSIFNLVKTTPTWCVLDNIQRAVPFPLCYCWNLWYMMNMSWSFKRGLTSTIHHWVGFLDRLCRHLYGDFAWHFFQVLLHINRVLLVLKCI